MASSASLKIDRYGVGSLVIDGVDLSMSVAPEFTITGRRDDAPVVSVNLVGLNFEVDLDGADVLIPDEIARALEALGWKRP